MAPFLQNGWSYRLVDRCGASVGPSDHEYDKRFCQAYRYRSSESTIIADGAKKRPRPFNEVQKAPLPVKGLILL